MSVDSVIFLVVASCIIQFFFAYKVRRKWVKFIPIILNVIGLLFGIIVYIGSYLLYKLGSISGGVMGVSQYVALIVCIVLVGCFIGCLLGLLISVGVKQFNKRSF